MVIELTSSLVSAGHVGQILRLIERISDSENGSVQLSSLVESGAIPEVPLRSIIAKGMHYNWIEQIDDSLIIQDDPREYEDEDRRDTKRRMLMRMIIVEKTKWSRFLRNGPTDAFVSKLTSNEKQLFREFGLLIREGILMDENAEKWWYDAQNLGWNIENDIRSEHGKIGEELSMDWEEERTGSRPIWVSRKDSQAGFDIESVQSYDCPDRKLIEVKATTSGSIFVTRNEAKVCFRNKEIYFFHVWKLNLDDNRRSSLCTVTADEMMENFPSDQGDGCWQDVEIPIRSFDVHRFECPFFK